MSPAQVQPCWLSVASREGGRATARTSQLAEQGNYWNSSSSTPTFWEIVRVHLNNINPFLLFDYHYNNSKPSNANDLEQGRPFSLDPNLFILEMASQNSKGPRPPRLRSPPFRQAQCSSQGGPGNQKNLTKVTRASGSHSENRPPSSPHLGFPSPSLES